MGKVVKFAFLGAVAGGAIGAAQAYRRDEPVDAVGSHAGKTAAEGAAFGIVVGLGLSRRDKKRLARQRMTVSKALAGGSLLEAAKAVKPALEYAVEVARPKVEHAVEVSRPVVESAAERTREAASKAADAAKPKIERAAEVTMERTIDLTKAARAKAGDFADATRPMIENGHRRVTVVV
jgi:hypothetical protein